MNNRKCCFIGHRDIIEEGIEEKVYAAIIKEVECGCNQFVIGTHGDFDNIALMACRRVRDSFVELGIEVVLTSLTILQKNKHGLSKYSKYDDVDTVIYDIEDVHFKRQIIVSNHKMIDQCDTAICYVDEHRCLSGAVSSLRYAKRKGLKVINLFE
ncbi:MAG: hypothetical protein E7356_02435 [Clostridiales bacterium]|nr:hypothetical protein [Clostridiales bacterium]